MDQVCLQLRAQGVRQGREVALGPAYSRGGARGDDGGGQLGYSAGMENKRRVELLPRRAIFSRLSP